MAVGFETHLNVVHMGAQTAWANTATLDTFLVGVTNHRARHDVNIYRPEEVGLTAPSDLVQITRREVTLTLDVTPTYEQLHRILEMIFGRVTANDLSGVGSGPWERVYSAPINTSVDPVFYTIGRGQNNLFYVYDSCAVQQARFAYSMDNGFTATLDILARDETTGTYSSITRPEGYTPFPVLNANIYIDPATNAWGTTLIPGTLREATVSVNTNLHYKYFPGDIRAQGYGMGKWEVSITGTFEMNSTIKSLYDEFLTLPPDIPNKRVRLEFNKDSSHILEIDLYGTLAVDGDVWDDADGNVVINFRFDAAYDSPDWFKVRLVNDQSTP